MPSARLALLPLVLALSLASRTAGADAAPGAAVRVGALGRASVLVGGRTLWHAGPAGTRVVSDLVWSRARDAIAFTTRDAAGQLQLVVVLVGGDLDGQTLRWPVPARAVPAGRPVVTWIDGSRVAVGASQLQPALVASWTLASR